MRSFQLLFLLVFILIFFLTATGTIQNLKQIFGKRSFKFLPLFYGLVSFLILAGFVVLYIYPYQPREASYYPVYFFFNALLFTFFVFNLPQSVAFILHLIFSGKKRSPVLPYAGFIVAVGLSAGMLYGTMAGSGQLKMEQIDLYFANLPKNFDNYKIVQISDTHLGRVKKTGRLLEKVATKIDKIDPDILLFTGDMVNNFANELEGFDTILQEVTENQTSYAILGNHDYGNYSNWETDEKKQANFEGIINTLQENGFRLLRNEHTVIKKGSDSIFIAGVENWGHPPFPQYADLEKAIQGIPSDAFTILLTHDPAHWESKIAGKRNIELTLSGHTHGMQWGIKLAGIPFSLASLTRKSWGGLYIQGNTSLYVNTGLGTIGMPWRLDMPAEISVFTLKRGKID
ncbi:metallophosphoesterase [Mariniphaga sediminis]|uniref:metallophosphoesterase n=1 Tax=Mariniphaga sediminis TaxID=1628158 RepID=UPI0035676350